MHRNSLRLRERDIGDAEAEDGNEVPKLKTGKKGAAAVSDVSIQTASQFICNPGRWAYLHMLLLLSVILELLTAWFESCPCHPSKVFELHGASWARRYRAFITQVRSVSHGRGRQQNKPCPMNGRRAPEVAAGVHWVLVTKWFQQGHAQLLMVLLRVENHARDIILGDWVAGKVKIIELLENTFAYAKVIPFKLAILTYPDQQAARHGYRECMQQFQSIVARTTQADLAPEHHRWSTKLCHPASPLHALGLRFLDGEDINSERLRPFKAAATPLKFLLMTERSAERNHALAGMAILKASRHHEAYFSLGLRSSEIDAVVDEHTALVELGKCCAEVRDPTELANHFGLNRHPGFVDAIDAGAPKQKLLEVLRPIIYRCDTESQQDVLADATVIVETERKRRKRVHEANLPTTITGATEAGDKHPTEKFLRKIAIDHIRSHCAVGSFFFFRCCVYEDCPG